ncbi:ribonuclease T2 [Sporormia fimetaria CBS 119925]|uniref:Ribonuclease T2-like n=1 Tax=Sporormia fimetaria CBS 119925 TaxID=1340428 RepID=A0A6A6VNU3_9PLEO|nr:ribonuclease T2 [Sporormia fimetaria CBS 119925]
MAILEHLQTAAKEVVQNAASTIQDYTSFDLPSLRSVSRFGFTGASLLTGKDQTVMNGQTAHAWTTQSCPKPQLSCHNTTIIENLCCFNYPGGQMLQTQFWDTHPATGPDDSWTLHGLWPDRCDGSYDANCDSSRVYRNISTIIESFGKTDLLKYMQTYWKDYKGDDETFWQHEWSKHGTCISTLEPHCYVDHKATQEVVDYFEKAVELFKTLPSYEWLAAADILPSTTRSYTFSEIQSALAAHRPGVTVTLGCKYGALNEIWYHYDVRGSVQEGEFVPADPDGTKSSCPRTGIRYLPKHNRERPHPTTTSSGSQPTSTHSPSTGFEGRGFINVYQDDTPHGCIISKGAWYDTRSCATFTATKAPQGSGTYLSSRRGKCGVVSGAFVCGPQVHVGTAFTATEEGWIAAGGNAKWSSDKVVRGRRKEKVYAGAEHEQGIKLVWEGR